MKYSRWTHQDEAVRCFLEKEQGILEMATGTGKTRTAIRIIEELYREKRIDQVLIITYGNDLLDQWYKELLLQCRTAAVFRWYGRYKEFSRFQLTGMEEKILLISREGERIRNVLEKLKDFGERTLLIFDEVHGAGSEGFRRAADQVLAHYRYRLGLSATPVREYDEEGCRFLEECIGPVIFRFGLADAIRKGILCGFSYIPLYYELTAEEKRKKRNIISRYEQMRKEGIAFQEEEKYRELAASSFPLKLAASLLEDIKTAAENEKEQSEMRIFLDQFSKLYDRYFQKKEPGPELQGLLENVKSQVRSEESIYGLDRDDLSHLEEIPGVLEEESRQCEMLLEEKRRLDRKLEEINNYLAVKVEDMQIEMIHQRLAENGYQIGQAEAGLQIAEEEYGLLNSRKESLEKSREQILWKVVREEEESDENRRMISYAQMQTEIMKKYKDELQALKADDLAAQMTECFGRIIAKEGLIQKIQIDHKTLEFSYYNKNGRRVEHQMLSSGEKQILVIAMLWALGICSKAEFPLIIDTPLGRLDSIHRTSLIENYFPKASEQVIILSTDQEITDKDYQALKKYVGKEYTLVYDTETMSSSIRSGYFGGKRI